MAWDFETEPEFQAELDWIERFVEEEIQPVDRLIGNPLAMQDPLRNKLIKPLQARVKARGLWGFHLGKELGGPGHGQLRLALMNESLGRSRSAPVVFGCHAPDAGNAEILAHFGTAAQKERFLTPLLANEITSCFAMTEPQGGADPTGFQARAERIGGEWCLNGEKWFATHARFASFLITMAVTEPDAESPYKRMSMFIVPTSTEGIETVRNMSVVNEPGVPSHAYLRFNNVRVPAENLLGEPGEAFAVAQVRLGGGRVHHAMRTISQCRFAFDMMCERALSRVSKGSLLAKKQMVQEKIADSWLQLEQFRLFLLRTAWLIDKHQDYRKTRKDIAGVKVMMPRVLHDVAANALQIHGSLGMTSETPLLDFIITSFRMGIADGPTEVHKVTLARQILRDYEPAEGLFPSEHLPPKKAEAVERFRDLLESVDYDFSAALE